VRRWWWLAKAFLTCALSGHQMVRWLNIEDYGRVMNLAWCRCGKRVEVQP